MLAIRNAEISDAKKLLEIYTYYIENTAITFEIDDITVEEFQGRIETIKEKYPYLVAEEDGKIVGYAYANVFKNRAAYDHSCELTVYIDNNLKRKGYGRKLYAALEDELRKKGIKNLYACIGDPIEEDEYLTHDSEKFHASLGFRKIGTFEKCGFKFGRYYNMIWMEKLLEDKAEPGERVNVWKDEEYTYPLAFGFKPNFVPYIHKDEKVRPCMVVVPGGGYCVVSPTEGEIVAKKFYDMGYNAFVVTYTTNLLFKAPLKDQSMRDLSRAIRIIRRDADNYHIDKDKLTIIGFSAGAHLCGSVCVHFDDIKEEDESLANISNRPDSAILSYPVITSGEYAHRDSFNALLGYDATKEELDYYSLEKQVTKDTPPTFLWQTMPDETVPVENSYLYEEALRKAGVNHAHHVFSAGHHGLSLGNADWAQHKFGEPYTYEQTLKTAEAVRNGDVEVTPEKKEEILRDFSDVKYWPDVTYPEIELWPELADAWLKTL